MVARNAPETLCGMDKAFGCVAAADGDVCASAGVEALSAAAERTNAESDFFISELWQNI